MPGRDSSKDKNEGVMDKAKGRAKEAAGSLTSNEDQKAEGRADQASRSPCAASRT